MGYALDHAWQVDPVICGRFGLQGLQSRRVLRFWRNDCKKKIITIVTGRKIAHWLTLLRLKRPTSLQLLGERIRQARKIKGLSQEGLALATNIAPSYIGGVERGQRNPSCKVLCAIAKILGRDVGSLCRNLPQPDEIILIGRKPEGVQE